MVRGRVGSPSLHAHTHTVHWLKQKHKHLPAKYQTQLKDWLLTAWSYHHFVWASILRRNTHRRIRGPEQKEATEERRCGWDLWKSSVKKSSFGRRTKHRAVPDNYLHWTKAVISNSGCHWIWWGNNPADTRWSRRPFSVGNVSISCCQAACVVYDIVTEWDSAFHRNSSWHTAWGISDTIMSSQQHFFVSLSLSCDDIIRIGIQKHMRPSVPVQTLAPNLPILTRSG